SKFEEFNVRGSVTQINPGPVVTTFEFKPEAGVKYSRITTLNEDLCLGLQAESVLIERIPGKPTVGIGIVLRIVADLGLGLFVAEKQDSKAVSDFIRLRPYDTGRIK
ncbi:MAG: DNA translocase FtsK, partial [Burkholderiales bacterium]